MKRKSFFHAGLAILNAYEILPGAAHMCERMKEEFAELGIELDVRTNAEVFAYIGGDGKIKAEDLPYDFILYLDKDLYVSYLLEMAGYSLFNTANSIELCDDKMLTHMALANHGIKMPKTVSGPLCYSHNESEVFLQRLLAEFSFPFIAKDSFGSLGENVFLLKDEKELRDFESKNRREPRIYQEFISSSFGFDFRIIVIAGKYVAAMKRQNKTGDFRSNIALGGVGEKVVLPESYIKIAEKAARILGLDYVGVDLLQGRRGEPILCEMNSNAFIAGIERTTGLNVAKVYAEHIAKVIYR